MKFKKSIAAFAIASILFTAAGLGAAKVALAGTKPSPKAALDPDLAAKQALALFQKGQYARAKVLFMQAVKGKPMDPSYIYYLLASALYSKDYDVAKRAYNKIVVEFPPNSQFVPPATQLVQKYASCLGELPKIYYALEFAGYHWPRGKMPIKIYITNGLQAPDSCAVRFFSGTAVRPAFALFANPNLYSRLHVAQGFRPECLRAAIAGLNDWNVQGKDYDLLWKIVDRPEGADIFVFWSPEFGRAGMTVLLPTRVDNNEYKSAIQLSTEGAGDTKQLRAVSCHEFGHAFGLGHSSMHTDVMSTHLDTGGESLSTLTPTVNDKAALRALYDFE